MSLKIKNYKALIDAYVKNEDDITLSENMRMSLKNNYKEGNTELYLIKKDTEEIFQINIDLKEGTKKLEVSVTSYKGNQIIFI